MSLKYVNMDGSQEGTSPTKLPNSTSLKRKKLIKRVSLGVGVFAVLLAIVIAISFPGIKTFTNQLKITRDQAKKLSEAWQLQDVNKARVETVKLKAELEKLDKNLSYFAWTNIVPLVGSYYRDGHHFIKAGIHGSDAGIIITDSLIPFADALGLKGGGVGNAETYAQKAVEAMPKVVPYLDDIEDKMKLVRRELDQVNAKKYPKKIGKLEVRANIEQAIATVDGIESFMPELRPILMALPYALGSPEPKTYLILFQNDKEIRSTGGFITAYATAKVNRGRLDPTLVSEDAYRLDDKVTYRPEIPTQLRDYLKVNKFFIRDANISPDYVESMKFFEDMYDSASNVESIDGIIALDTEFVRALLEVVGEVHVPAYNETFTAKINPNYDIPDVVYKLELYSEQLLAGKENRKDLIGQLMNGLKAKVLGSDKKTWPKLLEVVHKMVKEKHLLAYSHDKSSQVLLEKYNYAGRIKDYDGDYLHFNSNNFAGLKGDLYVTQKIEQDITTADDGTVTKKVTFTNANPKQADGWLNPTVYTNWLRLYVPEGSKLLEGSVNEGKELGKQMYQTVLKTTPKNSASVTFTYVLPFKVKKGSEYKMLIQKQPGTGEPEVIIKVNGKSKEKFFLDTDREVKFKV